MLAAMSLVKLAQSAHMFRHPNQSCLCAYPVLTPLEQWSSEMIEPNSRLVNISKG